MVNIGRVAKDTLFTDARSHSDWHEHEITDEMLHSIYDLMKFCPTAANTCPARITFIKSELAKARIRPFLDSGNVHKVMTAPIVAIISYDTEFYEKLPILFPHTDARNWYVGNEDKIKSVGKMNATLQAAYFMMATRSVGLDCGPMTGFDNEKLDLEFYPNGKSKSIMICSIGRGIEDSLHPRGPRLDFEEACKII